MPARKKKEKRLLAAPETETNDDRSVYADLFEAADQVDFHRVAGVDGIDDEIELLRVQIRKAIEGEANPDLKLIIQATNAIERLVRTRYRITAEQSESLRESVRLVIKDAVLPLGIPFLNRMLGD